jgi:ribonuclease HI
MGERARAYTDGGCTANGRAGARASFAAAFVGGGADGARISGSVPPLEFALLAPEDPAQGFAPVAGRAVLPSNNRGEYLAWCWALLILLRAGETRAEIVSDCNLFIMTMTEWLPARRRKGTADRLKNFDLVTIGDALLAALRARGADVALTHVNSHRPCPPDAPGARDWAGNDLADRLATAALQRDADVPEVVAAPEQAPLFQTRA